MLLRAQLPQWAVASAPSIKKFLALDSQVYFTPILRCFRRSGHDLFITPKLTAYLCGAVDAFNFGSIDGCSGKHEYNAWFFKKESFLLHTATIRHN